MLSFQHNGIYMEKFSCHLRSFVSFSTKQNLAKQWLFISSANIIHSMINGNPILGYSDIEFCTMNIIINERIYFWTRTRSASVKLMLCVFNAVLSSTYGSANIYCLLFLLGYQVSCCFRSETLRKHFYLDTILFIRQLEFTEIWRIVFFT